MKRLVFLALFVLGCGYTGMPSPPPPEDEQSPLPGHQGVDIDGDYTDPIFSSDDLKDAASTDQDAVVDH